MIRSSRMAGFNRSAGSQFWRLAWPASVEGLIVMLIFSANLLMVSNLGPSATSAVGIFAQPQMVLLFIARAFSVAVSALIANRCGQGRDDLSACLKQSAVVMTVVYLVMLAAAFALIEPILRLAGAKRDYMLLAVGYARPAVAALFFIGVSTVLNAGLLGVGQTKVILVANVAGNMCSLGLGAVLIHGWYGAPALGVAGAGLGNLAGAVVSLAISLYVLLHPDCAVSLRGRADWRPKKQELSALWQVFTGAFAEQGVERVGMFLYSRMAADLGTTAFAVHTVCMNLCNLHYSFAQGLGKASLVLAGRTLGAGDRRAFADTARAGQQITFALSVLAFLFYALLRMPLLRLYDTSGQMLQLGGGIMLFVAAVSFPQAHAMICAGTLRGAGKTRFVAVYSLISIAVARPILTWVLAFSLGLGLYGAWIALLLDQTARAVCSTVGVRRLKRCISLYFAILSD